MLFSGESNGKAEGFFLILMFSDDAVQAKPFPPLERFQFQTGRMAELFQILFTVAGNISFSEQMGKGDFDSINEPQ